MGHVLRLCLPALPELIYFVGTIMFSWDHSFCRASSPTCCHNLVNCGCQYSQYSLLTRAVCPITDTRQFVLIRWTYESDSHLCYCIPGCFFVGYLTHSWKNTLACWDSSPGMCLGTTAYWCTSEPCIPLDLKGFPIFKHMTPKFATSSCRAVFPGKAGRNHHN